MKKIFSAVACAAVIGWAGSAIAAPITFTDVEVINSFIDGFGDSVKWTHNFTFDPPAQSIISGRLSISFEDDRYDPWYAPYEFAYGYTDALEWTIGEVDTGTRQYSVLASSLGDGSLGVTIRGLGGDFWVRSSSLEITYNPVPEPTTILLFGTGLAGLAAFGRRRKEA